MANYVSMGRTNRFTVRDVQELQQLLHCSGIELDHEGGNTVVLLDIEGCGWTICGESWDDDIYLPDVISGYLQPGEVAVFQSIGHEKFRYLAGDSVACNARGEQVWVHLNDIYATAAAAFGIDQSSISIAEY